MNEGWASYWHARLLREADFLPAELYVDAIKCHCDVVRPVATGDQVALAINPYHLGFTLWERIIAKQGLEAAKRIVRDDDDCSFVRNYLTQDLADELQLFRFQAKSDGNIKVAERDLAALHEAILAPKYHFGAPNVAISAVRTDGTLELRHDHSTDGRGLDSSRAEKVLGYLRTIWRRPIELFTIDGDNQELKIAVAA
jgi:stage V sporulation protein R